MQLRWRCSLRAHLGIESYSCLKSINAACNLGIQDIQKKKRYIRPSCKEIWQGKFLARMIAKKLNLK